MKFSIIKNNIYWLTILAALFLSNTAKTQSSTVSPYSRYAIGDLSTNPHSSFFGMSGTSLSMCDSFQFNSLNPASYSFLLPHRPIFDIGLGGQFLTLSSSTENTSNYTFNLKAISLALPINKRWGMAFGITPLSSIGYNFVSHSADPVIGDITYKYDGKGGINRLFIGGSYLIKKSHKNNLSVGANLDYLFGSINSSSRAIIDDMSFSQGVLHSKVVHNIFVGDFIGEGGLLYRGKLNESSFLNFGSNITFGSNLYAKRELLAYTFNDEVTEQLVDTVEYQESVVGRVFIPKKIGFAVSYEKHFAREEKGAHRRLLFSAQYDLQDWGKYAEIFDNDTIFDGMKNTRTYSISVQYNPFSSNIIGPEQKWWQLSTYRLAFTGGTNYLQLDSTRMNHYGISFGIGIPMLNSGSFSVLNIGVEAGKRGSFNSDLINENYINLNIGLTISPSRSDPWFVKRKYD